MANAKTKEPAAAGSGKGLKIALGAMALLLVGAIGAIGYLMGHRSTPEAAAGGEAAAAHEAKAGGDAAKGREPVYLALDPPFVVNFQSDSATRFLQVGVQLMARDPKVLDAAKASEPAVRNALVMLFSSQDAKTLISREGKEKLRSDAQAEIQKIIAERLKGGALEAVYFTSFVMQ